MTAGIILGHFTSGSGTYTLSGGTINASSELVGNSGTGVFNQSGGTNTLTGTLTVGGGGSGAYNLSGGVLTALSEFIGDGGTGVFTQTGGANTLTNALTLGQFAGSSGTYNLSGGGVVLNASSEIIGSKGTGVFNQSGGTNTLAGDLTLGSAAGSSGTYTLSGGVLNASSEIIGKAGTGVFTQSGGVNALTGNLTLGFGVGSSGTYTQSGGAVTARDILLGVLAGSSGTYNLQGGNLNLGTAALPGTVYVNGIFLPTVVGIFNQTGGNLLNVAAAFPFSFSNAGTFNYSGGTFAGRLQNSRAAVDVNGVVNFNANFTAGNGLLHYSLIPLTINAGRTVTLNGAGGAPDFNLDNWATIIVNGTLAAGAGAGPLVNNNTGPGLMVGTGTIQGALINQGTVDPGNYLPAELPTPANPRPQNQQNGVLNVTGSFAQTATGSLRVDVLSVPAYDRLNVAGAPGTAILAGTVAPTLRGGFIPLYNQVFANVITAPGGLVGTFDTVANQQINLMKFWQPVYLPNQFDFRVAADFANVPGLNPNQLQVGVMLNTIAPSAPLGSDLNSVLNAIANLPTFGQVAEAYTQISPAKAAVLPNLALAGAKLQWQTLSQRLTSLRYGTAGGQLGRFALQGNGVEGLMMAYTAGTTARDVSGPVTGSRYLDTEGQWAVYTDFNMALGSFANTVGLAGCNYTMPGFTLGADYRLRDDLLIGVATGYQNTNADFDGSGGNVTGNTWPLTVYAAWFPGQAYVYGSLGYALNLYDLERNLSFGGLNRVAQGSTTGNQFNLYTEGGYDFKAQPFTITPTVNLAYSYLNVGSFTESGAGALNLNVGSQSVYSLQTGIGARFAVDLKINQTKMVPQVYALYVHEFGDSNRNLNASLATTPGSGFTYRTSEPGRDFAVVGGSLTAGLSKNLSLNVNYNAEVGRKDSTSHFINAGLRYVF